MIFDRIFSSEFISILQSNTFYDYIFAIGIFIVSWAILRIVEYVILRKLEKFAKKTKTEVDDVIVEAISKVFRPPFYSLVSLYFAVKTLSIPDILHKYINYFLMLVFVFYGIKFLSTFVDYSTRRFIEKEEKKEKKKIDTSAIKVMNILIKVILWLIALLLILSNLGYNVTSLMAGLGIGGIAIAFALQNVLSDIFASFSIYFDKPFETGDFIIVGEDAGIVKKIGIQSTRITTLHGEELVVSNKELTNTRIHNYKKMKKRRIVFTFGVEYGTSAEKLEKIPKIIKDIISNIKGTEVNRIHFKKFGNFSLDFEVVYYISTGDYIKYMDIQQEINLKIKKAFEKEKIVFAFPTQTIFLNK